MKGAETKAEPIPAATAAPEHRWQGGQKQPSAPAGLRPTPPAPDIFPDGPF